MKKLLITIAIVLGMGFGAFAQGGLFQYGAVSDENYYGAATDGQNRDGLLSLPGSHNLEDDVTAPLGSGLAVLMGLGAAYLVGKKRKEK